MRPETVSTLPNPAVAAPSGGRVLHLSQVPIIPLEYVQHLPAQYCKCSE